MAGRNPGRFFIELPEPNTAFLEFLHELVLIDGLCRIAAARRYLPAVEIGRCFENHAVVQVIAECVGRHFYPQEPVILETSDRDCIGADAIFHSI